MAASIEFHCNHCGKMIKTSGEHAGKRGKCPHCHNVVYIPTPDDELEPLRLAPVDDEDEQERRQLEEESRKIAQRLRSESDDVPPELAEKSTPAPEGDARLPSDMELLVTEYILCMSQGKLDEAEKLAEEIRKDMGRAEDFIQRLTMDELPPAQLADIPRAVINGFVKQLREES